MTQRNRATIVDSSFFTVLRVKRTLIIIIIAEISTCQRQKCVGNVLSKSDNIDLENYNTLSVKKYKSSAAMIAATHIFSRIINVLKHRIIAT